MTFTGRTKLSVFWTLCVVIGCCFAQKEVTEQQADSNSTSSSYLNVSTASETLYYNATDAVVTLAPIRPDALIPAMVGSARSPDLSVLEKQLIPQLLNVSENIVDERDKEAELLAWEAPLAMQAHYPYYLSGFDQENRPIWVAELGKWNVRKVVEAGGDSFSIFDKYVAQARLRITKSRALRSTPDHVVNEGVFLVDLDHLDLAQVTSVPTVSYILNLARQYRKLLTDHTGVAVVVNANFVAETLVNLIRPVFGSILEKTEIYGTNRGRWVPNVLRHFPKDQIPEWYGGTKGYTPIKVYG